MSESSGCSFHTSHLASEKYIECFWPVCLELRHTSLAVHLNHFGVIFTGMDEVYYSSGGGLC
jgi:hypothetical protein